MATIASILHEVIIYPLYALLEAAFVLCDSVFKKESLAIAGLSITVSLLTLPLYIVAERWAVVERETQKSLKNAVERIKTTFTGDEQYMMLSTLYREKHYHPLMALRSSIGLIIQIPFFIAAYSFLSHLSLLEGNSVPLLLIADLSMPDGILPLFGLHINRLPILMTIINIVAGAIYTKGLELKDKVPIYTMALLFLVLLYNSPSGLVLYWTMNNIFSLVKNVFYRIKKPLRAAYIILCIAVIAVIRQVLFFHSGFLYRRVMFSLAFALTLTVPLLVRATKYLLNGTLKSIVEDKRLRFMLFMFSAVSIALLLGSVGPSLVIGSSVVEFCGVDNVKSPLYFVFSSLLQSAGLFIFWPLIVYLLFGKRIQTLIAMLFVFLLISATVNTFIFPSDAGNISRLMTFDSPVTMPPIHVALLNMAIIIVFIAIAAMFIAKERIKILATLIMIMGVALALTSVVQCTKIGIEVKSLASSVSDSENNKDIKSVYHLSKEGQNVIVIMMDRAESAYLRPIFNTFQDIKKKFTGFTFYPNTVSYNQGTLLGAPPLYGGYSYTPLEMNKRASEKLVAKHTEALLMMPRIFTEQASFTATVADLSWAGYKWIPDMSITNPYPLITGFNTERRYSDLWVKEHPKNVKSGLTKKVMKRNMLYFSLFKASPTFLRDSVYDDGGWWSSDEMTTDVMGFIDYYSVLDYLPRLTDFEGEGDKFIMFANNTTHSGQDLSPPDYEPRTERIYKRGPVDYPSADGNTAMYKLIGRWLDLLKENDCYDNTRIIIVADHGIGKEEAFYLAPYKGWGGKSFLGNYIPDHNNPLLLVKDFNASGELKIDNKFMTNADVLELSLKDIVKSPLNPWTNTPITFPSQKDKKAVGVVLTHMWNPGSNVYTFKVPKSDWVTIKDNIFDASNWQEGVDK